MDRRACGAIGRFALLTALRAWGGRRWSPTRTSQHYDSLASYLSRRRVRRQSIK